MHEPTMIGDVLKGVGSALDGSEDDLAKRYEALQQLAREATDGQSTKASRPPRREGAGQATLTATAPSRPARKALNAQAQARLPFWPEDRRGVPNDVARSALFTVRQREPRVHYKGERIASLKNMEIIYTGEELRQRDEDVLLQLLHFGRLAPVGEPIRFVAVDMLRALGWTINSRSYAELAESIERLKASSIHIVTKLQDTKRGYAGSLVRTFEYVTRGESGQAQWTVTFEPRIISLFSHVAYTLIDWQQRKRLSPLAKWLHSFYFSHQAPYPMKVSTLRELSGSATKDLFKFRQSLKQALASLAEAGFLTEWRIREDGDVVEVRRAAVGPPAAALDDPQGQTAA